MFCKVRCPECEFGRHRFLYGSAMGIFAVSVLPTPKNIEMEFTVFPQLDRYKRIYEAITHTHTCTLRDLLFVVSLAINFY